MTPRINLLSKSNALAREFLVLKICLSFFGAVYCNCIDLYIQGCGAGFGVVRSRGFLGGVRVGFLTTLGVGVGFFVRLRMSNWIIFTSYS